MRDNALLRIALAAFGGCATLTAAVATAAPDGTAAWVDRVRVSPAGDRVLAIAGGEGRHGLAVIDLATGTLRVALQPDLRSSYLDACDWASNDRIVCSMFVFPRRTGPDPPVETTGKGPPYPRRRLVRLAAVDHDGGNLVELIRRRPSEVPKFAGVWRPPRHPLDDMEHALVHMLPDEPHHVLVAAPRETSHYASVYRVDLRDGEPTRMVGFQFGIVAWHADQSGRVRLGTGWYEFGNDLPPIDGRRTNEPWLGPTAVAAEAGGGFRRVDVADLSGPIGPEDLAGPRVLGFSRDGARVYYEARVAGADRTAVWLADAATLEPARRLVADERRDVHARAVAGRDCGVVGFMHPLPGRPFTWLEPGFAPDVAAAERRIGAEVVAVTSLSADCRRMVLAATDGYSARSFHLLDRDDGGLRRLGEQRAGVGPDPSVERRAVDYATRDGLALPMTVTLPTRGAEPPPVVVLLDGGAGPYSDDPLNAWPHFFASRGYAVAQPAVRGMRGFGAAFHQAGMRERGARVQTDVADAVRWLAAEGLADARRTCFAGRGRGGHLALVAALAASSAEPETARCAAAYAVRDMEASKRGHGPQRDSVILPRDDWMRWTAPGHSAARTRRKAAGRHARDSMLRSPLVDGAHPGFPTLIHNGIEGTVHEGASRAYRSDVRTLGMFDYVAPVGGAAEADFLAAAEELFARVLKVGETAGGAPSEPPALRQHPTAER